MFDAILNIGWTSKDNNSDNAEENSKDWLTEEYISRVKVFDASLHDPLTLSSENDSDSNIFSNASPLYVVQAKSIQSQTFHSLSSQWILSLPPASSSSKSIEDLQHASECYVEFQVELSVTNPIVALTLNTVLEQVAQQQLQAFQLECQKRPLS